METENIHKVVAFARHVVRGLQDIGEKRKQQAAQPPADPPSLQSDLRRLLERQGVEVPDLEQLARDASGQAGLPGRVRAAATGARAAQQFVDHVAQGQEDPLTFLQRALEDLEHLTGGRVVARTTGHYRPDFAGPTAAKGVEAASTPTPTPSDAPQPTAADKRALYLALHERVERLAHDLQRHEEALTRRLDGIVERLTRLEELILVRSAPPPSSLTFEKMLAAAASASPDDEETEPPHVSAPQPRPSGTPEDEDAGASAAEAEPSTDDTRSEEATANTLGRGREDDTTGEASLDTAASAEAPPDDALDRALRDVPMETLRQMERRLQFVEQNAVGLFYEAEIAAGFNEQRVAASEAAMATLLQSWSEEANRATPDSAGPDSGGRS